MLTLIFMLWAVDVVLNIQAVSVILLVAYGITAATYSMWCFLERESIPDFIRKKSLNVIAAILVALLVILPSKTTMYSLIALKAAQEVGQLAQSVVETRIGKKTMDALEKVLDDLSGKVPAGKGK